jgi:hypothetical protein
MDHYSPRRVPLVVAQAEMILVEIERPHDSMKVGGREAKESRYAKTQ